MSLHFNVLVDFSVRVSYLSIRKIFQAGQRVGSTWRTPAMEK